MPTKKMTMGLIVGNRGFFPDHLAKSGREEMLRVLDAAGMDVVALTPEESKYGAVETRVESHRCAGLFKKNRDRIDGVIVTLPNFGEERAIADTLRLADLHVPVLIQATPDDPKKMTIAFRRDSFSGTSLIGLTDFAALMDRNVSARGSQFCPERNREGSK